MSAPTEQKRRRTVKGAPKFGQTNRGRGGVLKGLLVTNEDVNEARLGDYFIMVKAPTAKQLPNGNWRRINRAKGHQAASSILTQWGRQWKVLSARTAREGRAPSADEISKETYIYIPSLRIGGLLADLQATQVPVALAPGGLGPLIANLGDAGMNWNMFNTVFTDGQSSFDRFTAIPAENWNQPVAPGGPPVTRNTGFINAVLASRAKKVTGATAYTGIPLADLLWLRASVGRTKAGGRATVSYYDAGGTLQLAGKETKGGISRTAVQLLDKARTDNAAGKILDVTNLDNTGHAAKSVKRGADRSMPAGNWDAGSDFLNIYSRGGLAPIIATIVFAQRQGELAALLPEIRATTDRLRAFYKTKGATTDQEVQDANNVVAQMMSKRPGAPAAAAPGGPAPAAPYQYPPGMAPPAAAAGPYPAPGQYPPPGAQYPPPPAGPVVYQAPPQPGAPPEFRPINQAPGGAVPGL